jgi:hypothetical protein
VTLTVPKGLLNGTVLALLRSVFVNLITEPVLDLPKILAETVIGVKDAEIAVLNRQITRHPIEILSEGISHHALREPPEHTDSSAILHQLTGPAPGLPEWLAIDPCVME